MTAVAVPILLAMLAVSPLWPEHRRAVGARDRVEWERNERWLSALRTAGAVGI